MYFTLLFYRDDAAVSRAVPLQDGAVADGREAATGRLRRAGTALALRQLADAGAGAGRSVGLVAQPDAGFHLVECTDMDEAIRMVRAYPAPGGQACIELRPVLGTRDYAPSVDSPACAGAVWRCYADVAQWPDWKFGIDTVELDGPLATGAAGWIVPTGQAPMRLRIASAAAGEGYVSETELADRLVLHLEHYLTALPTGGTRITHRAVIPRGARHRFGPSFDPDFCAGVRATLRALAARVHREP